jgi:hypothetical protein
VRKKNAPWYGKAGENSTVWDSASPKFIMGGSDEQKFDHPTQRPVELMRRPILNHTKRGELIYEPFSGSGTTLAAAELTDRVCCGLELDPKYIDVIVQRWEQLRGKKQLSRQMAAASRRSRSIGGRRERRAARDRRTLSLGLGRGRGRDDSHGPCRDPNGDRAPTARARLPSNLRRNVDHRGGAPPTLHQDTVGGSSSRYATCNDGRPHTNSLLPRQSLVRERVA